MVVYNNGRIVLTEDELNEIKIAAGAAAVESAAKSLPRAYDRYGRAQFFLLGVASGMRKKIRTIPEG